METNDNQVTIAWKDFAKIELRIGTIISAELNPKANKPAYILNVDFGSLGIKTSSAQLTQRYQPHDLMGKQVVCVLNFAPKHIAGIKSEVLVLGAVPAEGDVILLQPNFTVPNGSHIA